MEVSTLAKFKKCDVFTPESIGNKMVYFLRKRGNLLEPSVGTGNLLNCIHYKDYTSIDVFDIKKEYLDKIPEQENMNKYCEDFIQKEFGETKYENIILNPPYIKIQDLPDEYRKTIKDSWGHLFKGNFDIYYIFLMKCIDLLRNTGIMVGIIPNSFLYTKSALHFREHLVKNRFIKEIIDFGYEKVFQNTSVYTCIVVFTKEDKNHFIYNGEPISYDEIQNKEFSLLQKENVNSQMIQPKLTLGDICKVRNGIATLANNIFIHTNKLYDEPCWKEIYTTKGIQWIIFPYRNKKIINENEFKRDNPRTYEFLETKRNILTNRDKGKKKYPAWYAFGRGQSIDEPNLNQKVLLIPNFIDPENIKFSIEKSMLFTGCLCIELIDKESSHIDNQLKMVQDTIQNNISFIQTLSSKRGGGWINLSSRILLQCVIDT